MEKLFAGFPAASASEWKARLEKDLKGITYDQLSLTDRNGITIRPFYTEEDMPEGYEAPDTVQPGWSICARIEVTDASAANREALRLLNKGVSGILFDIAAPTDPARLLQDIGLSYIYTCFRLRGAGISFAGALQEYLLQQQLLIGDIPCFVCCDAIGEYIRTGAWQQHSATDISQTLAPEMTGNGHTWCIDASSYPEAGAGDSYGLACTLAHINEYLNNYTAGTTGSGPQRLHISTTADTAFFGQIARLRALRRLVTLLTEQYGLNPDIHLHLETSDCYRSPFDSYSNLLRDTIAGMAAVLGGCNSLYIHPFDAAGSQDSELGKRMSRNQQLIFCEESYLDKVADVAAGSYYIETLTTQMAEQAWAHFQEIEAAGGLIEALKKGLISRAIDVQAEALVQEYRDGKRVLTGINKYINAQDPPGPLPQTTAANGVLKPLQLYRALL